VIVVDSSVWIEGFRGNPLVSLELGRLIELDLVALVSPVRLELLSGSSKGDTVKLRRLLSALPTYVPTITTWKQVESWVALAAKAGHRFGIMDLLIAATAQENSAAVWSLDEDFERMAKLRLLKLHRPRMRGSSY
jgi:predicted nucleic acid-binding protein